MKRVIRRVVSMVTMATILSTNLGILSVHADDSDSKEVATGINLSGNTLFYWTYPGGGMSVYHFDAKTELNGSTSGSWTLYSGIQLDYWPSGALISSNYVSGNSNQTPVTAPIQGAPIGTDVKAYSSHEVRGAYSGGIYTASAIKHV